MCIHEWRATYFCHKQLRKRWIYLLLLSQSECQINLFLRLMSHESWWTTLTSWHNFWICSRVFVEHTLTIAGIPSILTQNPTRGSPLPFPMRYNICKCVHAACLPAAYWLMNRSEPHATSAFPPSLPPSLTVLLGWCTDAKLSQVTVSFSFCFFSCKLWNVGI